MQQVEFLLDGLRLLALFRDFERGGLIGAIDLDQVGPEIEIDALAVRIFDQCVRDFSSPRQFASFVCLSDDVSGPTLLF